MRRSFYLLGVFIRYHGFKLLSFPFPRARLGVFILFIYTVYVLILLDLFFSFFIAVHGADAVFIQACILSHPKRWKFQLQFRQPGPPRRRINRRWFGQCHCEIFYRQPRTMVPALASLSLLISPGPHIDGGRTSHIDPHLEAYVLAFYIYYYTDIQSTLEASLSSLQKTQTARLHGTQSLVNQILSLSSFLVLTSNTL